MCRRFNCLPSQLYAEDADLIRMLEIEQLGAHAQEGDTSDGW